MSVIVVATVLPVPERRAEVLSALKDAVPRVHAEEGCDLYALHEGPDLGVGDDRLQELQPQRADLSGVCDGGGRDRIDDAAGDRWRERTRHRYVSRRRRETLIMAEAAVCVEIVEVAPTVTMEPPSDMFSAPTVILRMPLCPVGNSVECQPNKRALVSGSSYFCVASSVISTTPST